MPVKILCLLLLLAENGFAQAWRQIRPLRTSRKQVEKVLGRPKVIGGVSSFDFANETIDVFYLKRSCRFERQGWNVPVDTVTSVRIAPKKKVRLSETQWDLSKFRKELGSFDNPSHSLFVNEEDGVTLSVIDGVLDSYSFGPRRRDKKKRCPGYSIAEEQRLRDCMPIVLLVECSSEEISIVRPVSCRARFVSAPLDFSPTIDWSVSKNASFVREGQEIKVSIKNSNARTIFVTGRVTSPNICWRVASAPLHVEQKR